MTGGPDGDLGSNEILMSKEKILAIVDGSGVLFDPKGINREALTELCHKRLTISEYNGPLNEGGYKVLTTDVNFKLPSGEIVPNGYVFRDTFHLR